MTIALLISSLAGWCMFCAAHRQRMRELRRQSAEHRHELSCAFSRGRFSGLTWAARHRRELVKHEAEARP